MYSEISELLEDMRRIQGQLEQFFDDARNRFHYTLENGRVRFTEEVRELHRHYKVGSLRYLLDSNLGCIITAPVIYSMAIPLLFLDLTFTVYQHICFRAYGVPRVRRLDYRVNDRHRLGYLNTIEKINCAYCGYGNGVIAYAREIISRTEQYWCPIRHARHVPGAHERYPNFFDYGDAEAYIRGLEDKRHALGNEPGARGRDNSTEEES